MGDHLKFLRRFVLALLVSGQRLDRFEESPAIAARDDELRREEARELARKTPYYWRDFDLQLAEGWTPSELADLARLSDATGHKRLMFMPLDVWRGEERPPVEALRTPA